MAHILGVSASTISRELRRNTGKLGNYTKGAHKLALQRRSAKSKKRISPSQWEQIETLLRLDYSPEQISLRLTYLRQQSISHEWIYQYIHDDKQRGGTLHTLLRCKKP